MGIFSSFFSCFSSDSDNSFDSTPLESSSDDSSIATEINPANGLPMIGGMGGVDVMGNPYGTDSHSLFDDNSSFGSYSSFDSGCSSADSEYSSFDSGCSSCDSGYSNFDAGYSNFDSGCSSFDSW